MKIIWAGYLHRL